MSKLSMHGNGTRGLVGLVASASLCAMALAGHPAAARPLEPVTFRSEGAGGATLTAYLARPEAAAKPPVVIALHGCGGLLDRHGELPKRETDWADRLTGWGYAVLFVDSFTARGFREVCTVRAEDRRIRPRDRADDVAVAIAWIAANPALDHGRIALVGWSHGGASALWSVDQRRAFAPVDLRTAIAFYPGCRPLAESERWAPRVPLTILIGSADDWTRPGHCRTLVAKHPAIRYLEYPDAVHGFDAPDTPLRIREGLGIVGRARVGTDPKARAAAIAEVQAILAAAFK